MTIERLPSVRPLLPSRVIGTARGKKGNYVFEISDAQRLSLKVSFHEEPPPDGIVLSDVKVRVIGHDEAISLGRCRFEWPGPTRTPIPQSALDTPPPSRRVRVHSAYSGKLVPLEAPVNCRELFQNGRLVLLEETFEQLPLLFARKEVITSAFQRYTADLVYDLRIYRSLFDDIDTGLASESEATRSDVERAMIEGPGRRFMRFFDDRLAALERIVRSFSRQEHERHGFYFRRQVWDAILTAPLLARTNIRPRGYAGDWVMMQYVYQNDFVGPSIFGKLLHKHVLETAAAQAVRNRRKLIVEMLATAREDLGVDPASRLKFLSVACGSASEVDDIFATPEDCESYECALLDQDAEALGEAALAVEAIEQRAECPVRARFIRQSVRTMLRTRKFSETFGRYHVVYSMGLFDYLTAPVARAVLHKLYELIEPGGRMIIGNFHVSNPTRWYMDYWMDWSLIYRTEDELLALARDLPDAEASVQFEPTGSQMFLRVGKAAK